MSTGDKTNLVARSQSMDEKTARKRKFKFFSIGFNSKADSTPEDKENEQSSDTLQKRAAFQEQNRQLSDKLNSFDTEENYEDDVFTKGIIDLDAETKEIDLADILEAKQLFPKVDSSQQLVTANSSEETEEVEADLTEEISSKTRFNNLYYMTGSTEDLLKEVKEEAEREKTSSEDQLVSEGGDSGADNLVNPAPSEPKPTGDLLLDLLQHFINTQMTRLFSFMFLILGKVVIIYSSVYITPR